MSPEYVEDAAVRSANPDTHRLTGDRPKAAEQLRWLNQHRAGGPEAEASLDRLVASFGALIRGLARKIARQFDVDVEELVCDGKEAAVRSLKTFSVANGSRITTYVYTAVSRAMRAQAKRYRRWQMELLESQVSRVENGLDKLVHSTAPRREALNTLDLDSAAALRGAVRRALPSLNKAERVVASRVLGLSRSAEVFSRGGPLR